MAKPRMLRWISGNTFEDGTKIKCTGKVHGRPVEDKIRETPVRCLGETTKDVYRCKV